MNVRENARRLLAWLDSDDAQRIPGVVLVLKNGRFATWRLLHHWVVWNITTGRRDRYILN